MLAVSRFEETLPVVLRRQAAAFGARPLFRFGDEMWSYADTPERAASCAYAMRSAGLEVGDRIALMCGNRPEFLRVWLGAGWAGLVTVPVNVALRGTQLERILTDSGARALVIETGLVPHLEALQCDLPALELLWTIGGDAPAQTWRGHTFEPMPFGSGMADPYPARAQDTLTIFYTGGTTGPPAGVCCPHAQSYWWGKNVASQLEVREYDVLHTTLPLFHTNALHTFWQALLSGATFSLGSRFSASAFSSELRLSGATVTYLMGVMVEILVRRPPSSADTEHAVRIVLAPGTSADAANSFEARYGVELVDAYGSTETNMITSTRLAGSRRGTMGRVTDGFETVVVDADARPVAPGCPGELLIRNREPFSFFTGYWQDPERTLRATRNLWFHTGDRIVKEQDGCLRFLDRKKDAIRRRGENISSWEVEQVLLTHPQIANAAVVPVPAQLGEDEVLAFIVPAYREAPDPMDVLRHCEPRLAYFAIPRYVEFVTDLPLTEMGRIRKFMLRERGLGPRTWDREATDYVLERD
jgi:crotonobetaine/carnitine-CoA ligase